MPLQILNTDPTHIQAGLPVRIRSDESSLNGRLQLQDVSPDIKSFRVCLLYSSDEVPIWMELGPSSSDPIELDLAYISPDKIEELEIYPEPFVNGTFYSVKVL